MQIIKLKIFLENEIKEREKKDLLLCNTEVLRITTLQIQRLFISRHHFAQPRMIHYVGTKIIR